MGFIDPNRSDISDAEREQLDEKHVAPLREDKPGRSTIVVRGTWAEMKAKLTAAGWTHTGGDEEK